MSDQDAFLRILSEFPRLLVRDYEISDSLHDLVDGVTEVLGIRGAGISLATDDDRLAFATAADEVITRLERAQEESQHGPCIDAHAMRAPILVTDLAERSDEWPLLVATASAHGIVAAAGIPMHLNGTRIGVLDLYHDRRRDWSANDVAVATVLAAIGSGLVANAHRLDQIRQTADQLQEALASRVVIEQAKGIIAGEKAVSLEAAFGRMRQHARSHRASLRSVADAVVNLGLRP